MLSATDLKGIIPPTTTPLTSGEAIDRDAVARLMDYFVDAGVGAIFALGSSGEFACMSATLKLDLVDAIADSLGGRVPLLAGVTSASYRVSLDLAREFGERGVDAIVATTPYYFHYRQTELIEYFTRLAESSPLPLVIYDIPARADNELAPETVLTLSEHERIIGIKDSTGNIERGIDLATALRGRDDFAMFQGSERLLAMAVLSGYSGGVLGFANAFPRLCVAVYEAAANHDIARAQDLQELISGAFPWFFAADPGTTNGSSIVGAMKVGQELQGLCSRRTFFPMRQLTDDDVQNIRRYIDPLADAGWLTYA